MHGKLFAELPQFFGIAFGLQSHDHRDLPQPRCRSRMNIMCDDARLHGKTACTPQPQVLADGRDQSGQSILDTFGRIGPGQRRKSRDVTITIESEVGTVTHEVLEHVIVGHEVGFRIDLDDRSPAAIHRNGRRHEAFGCHTAGLLGCRGQSLGTEPVDSGLHVT